MTDPKQVLPSKCSQCNATIEGTLVCDYCRALNPAATMLDYFSLLDVPTTFDIDEAELRRKYLALSRHAHPDFHTTDGPEVQQLHLQVSAALNDAYKTLSDPASRAAYLLERLGGHSAADDKSVPEGFLGTMMMMQEELEEAREASDKAEYDRLESVLMTQRNGLVRRIGELFDDYQQAVSCKAVTTGLLDELRKQINAVSYVRKLLDQLREARKGDGG